MKEEEESLYKYKARGIIMGKKKNVIWAKLSGKIKNGNEWCFERKEGGRHVAGIKVWFGHYGSGFWKEVRDDDVKCI